MNTPYVQRMGLFSILLKFKQKPSSENIQMAVILITLK